MKAVEGGRSQERKGKKCGESRRTIKRKKKIGLASIASVYMRGQGQEDEDQRKRTIVTGIGRQDERKMKALMHLDRYIREDVCGKAKTNALGCELIANL